MTNPAIGAYQFDAHVSDHAQYFSGRSVAYTKWDNVYVGAGTTPLDAYNDALDQAASEYNVEGVTADSYDYPDRDVDGIYDDVPEGEDCELYYYVSLWVENPTHADSVPNVYELANACSDVNDVRSYLGNAAGRYGFVHRIYDEDVDQYLNAVCFTCGQYDDYALDAANNQAIEETFKDEIEAGTVWKYYGTMYTTTWCVSSAALPLLYSDILEHLAQYPSLDDDKLSQIESDRLDEEIDDQVMWLYNQADTEHDTLPFTEEELKVQVYEDLHDSNVSYCDGGTYGLEELIKGSIDALLLVTYKRLLREHAEQIVSDIASNALPNYGGKVYGDIIVTRQQHELYFQRGKMRHNCNIPIASNLLEIVQACVFFVSGVEDN